jgi:polysaccharide biosynthesis transport protein
VLAQDGPRPDIAGAVARAVSEPPPPPPNLDELPEPADPDQMKAPPLERPRVVLPPQPQIIPAAMQDEPEAVAEPVQPSVSPHDEWYENPHAPEPAPRPAAGLGDNAALANLSADLTLGRARIVLLSGLLAHEDVEAVANKLVDDALSRGLSVALVDAGSGVASVEPGITDLALDAVSFGDVVFKSEREGLAEVPWGHMAELNLASGKPMTLVEALTDIYESVIVLTGLGDAHSSLPAFEGLECRVVLVARGEVDEETLSAFGGEVLAMGFPYPQVVFTPTRRAEVA